MSLLEDLRTIEREARRAQPDVDIATVTSDAELLERVAGPISTALAAVQELKDSLLPDPKRSRWLQGTERANSFIAALESLAQARGAGLFAPDSLHAAVVDHAPSQDKPWWNRQLPGLVVGMLRSEPEIRDTLAERGVLIWEGKGSSHTAGDELWRLVNLNSPDAHADVYRRVTERLAGRRCQLCGITENPRADELHPLRLDRRHGALVVNGIVAVAARDGVLLHAECRSKWLEWVAIASKYSSLEEAEAADAAAGRKPCGVPEGPRTLELDPPLDPPPMAFPTGEEFEPPYGGDAA